MKIEANDKEIQDIFSQGYFKIPRFQRAYSWETDEVERFWNDVVIDNPESYFIGSMVVYQTKKPYFGVVDGQQRLTTITLILSVIRNAFIRIGEDNLAKGVHKYIETPNIDNEDEFILRTETSFPYLQNKIQSFTGYNINTEVGSEEKKLEDAFKLIVDRLNIKIPGLKNVIDNKNELLTYSDPDVVRALKDIRDKVISLKLVFIQLDSEDDAYLIFETLNARGRDLTTSDLVKNIILKKIKSSSISIDQAKESWNSIVSNFDGVNISGVFDSFLLHFWISKHKYVTEKKLFLEVKKYINNDVSNAKILLDGLSIAAQEYVKIINPKYIQWEKSHIDVRNSLMALKNFKVKQHSAISLSLLTAYNNKIITLKNLKFGLNKIEIFHYLFNAISSKRSGGSIATNYSKLAIELSHASNSEEAYKVLKSLQKSLKDSLPDEDEFTINFRDLVYSTKKKSQKNVVKYSLSKLIPVSHGCLTVDLENLTIEHIVPESNNKEGEFPSVASIGNLILLDGTVNSNELSNKSTGEKFSFLKENGFPVKEAFIEDVAWDKAFIEQRVMKISRHIYKLISDEF